MGFEINNVDFRLGDIKDYNLLLIHHSEEVNDVFIPPFEEDLT